MAYDATTTLAYETGKTGTGWTVDVTDCNLSTDLTDKDFKVWIDDTLASNSDFTKTSAVLLTYGGTATSSATVEVHRSTSTTRVKTITPGEALQVADIENELERILRVLAELQAFYQEDPPSGQAGAGGIVSRPYNATWDGATNLTSTKGSLYTQMELESTIASPTFTGIPKCPDIANTLGAGNYTAANRDSADAILTYRYTDSPALTSSPSDTTDDSTPATSAFVKSATRVIFQETVDTSGTLDYPSAGGILLQDTIDFGANTYNLLVMCLLSNANPTSEPPSSIPTVGASNAIDLDDSDTAVGSWGTTDMFFYGKGADYSAPVWIWAYFENLTGSHTIYWKGDGASARNNISAEFRLQLVGFPA